MTTTTRTRRGGGTGSAWETLFRLGAAGALGDGELLDRFVRGGPGGEAAFEALVARHGPMVLRVCHMTLADPHDAQDAFQATFLVLARRAGAIRRRESIGGWLFGVASRVSARARVDAARRRRLERHVAILSDAWAIHPGPDELGPVVRREVAALPSRYREVVVLCYLQGLSCEAAAARVGCPLGTVKTRLSRARGLLKTRLARRGLGLPAGLVAAGAGVRSASATASAFTPLANIAARVALGGLASRRVEVLARGVLRALSWTPGTFVATASVALLGLLAAGVVATAGPTREGAEAAEAPARVSRAPDPEGRAIGQALRAVDVLDDLEERAEALFSLGQAQARRGDWGAAREAFARTLEVAAGFPPLGPRRSPHVAIRVANALAECGDRSGAHRAFERARALILDEDEEGWRGRDWADLVTWQVATEGRDAARVTLELHREEVEREPHPNVIHRGVSWARARAGDFDGALRRLREKPRNRAEESSLVRLWLKLGVAEALRPADAEVAGPLLEEIRGLIAAEEGFGVRARESARLAGVLEGLGTPDEAIAALDAIPIPSVPPDARNLAAWRAAIDRARDFRAYGYVQVGLARARAGDRDRARRCAFAALTDVEAMGPDEAAWSRFLAAYFLLKVDEPGEAHQLITTLDPPRGVIALNALASYQARAGDGAAARLTAGEAVGVAEDALRGARAASATDMQGIDQGVALTIGRAKARPGETAAEVAYPQSLYGLDRDGYAALIARVEARHGSSAAARLAVGRIRDARRRAEALGDVAAGLAWRGDVDEAVALAESLETPRERALALIRVAAVRREWDEP